MSERTRWAAQFSKKIDKHKERCGEGNCVNWHCDGTRHRNLKGDKWGEGWLTETEEQNDAH
jgi:hypothetical protein